MAPDYYQILAIPRTASAEQIKLSFHNLAKLYHPDVSSELNAEQKFQEISQAYNTLIDPKKKIKYDLKIKYGVTYKPKSQESHKDFKKYGTRDKNRDYAQGFQYQKKTEENKKSLIEKIFTDKFMFGSLLIVGIIAIIFGLVDLFFIERKVDEPIHINGLILGVVITTLLVVGWKSLKAGE
ncbi:MAG: DnaJ domain-containing protein [Saprospiraceae bacterium]|nr:DnaJ domain-containing protein [Saprospiraceae bacterium]